MRSILLMMGILCAGAWAQPQGPSPAAPPEVDAALRERVTAFFQAHVDGKFRQAEQYVAEDSKDAFYDMDKRRYLSYRIDEIKYSDNFTKATVLSTMELEWRTPRFGAVRMKPPLTTYWKIDNGKWGWYFVPQETIQTPFGPRTVRNEVVGGGLPGQAGAMPMPLPSPDAAKVPEGPRMTPEQLMSGVKADRSSFQMETGKTGQQTFKVTNTLAGTVQVQVQMVRIPGLTATLDKTTLQANESATVTLAYDGNPEAKTSGILGRVRVEPTGQEIPIQIRFSGSR